jgi:hypothetical protein
MPAAISTPLQQTLNYLKQGHATVPAQQMIAPTFNPAGNMQGQMPSAAPPIGLMKLQPPPLRPSGAIVRGNNAR